MPEYKAMVKVACKRCSEVTIEAANVNEARAKLECKYGKENVAQIRIPGL